MAGHHNLHNETPDELPNEIAGPESAINSIVDPITERIAMQAELEKYRTHFETLVQERTEELWKHKTFLETIIESEPECVKLLAPDCSLIMMNRSGLDMIGADSLDQVRGQSILDLVDPPFREAFKNLTSDVFRGGAGRLQFRITGLQGVCLWLETYAVPLRDENNEITAALGITRNITDCKLAEMALKKSEEFVRNILESIGEGLIVIDPDYRIISANSSYIANAKGMPANIIGEHCYRISHNSDTPCFQAGERCPVRMTFETGEPSQALHIHTDRHGNSAYVEVRSYPMRDDDGRIVSVIETINDITAQRKLEDQLRNAQRLEAIGQLAGGIAHDFNNILTAILGYGNLLQMTLDDTSPMRKQIDQIVSSAEKAANLTQSLLAYSRKQIINPQPVKINAVISRIETMLSRLISEDIGLKIILTEKDPTIIADSGQLEQVLLNLVTNARDAMPGGGALTIQTGLVDIEEKYTNLHSHLRAGSHVVISVTDTGIGMDEKTQEKIFDPFFTTKEVGKGTGLGLAMAYGIIRQHDGFIGVFSEPGKGTTFSLYLPAVETEVSSAGAPDSVEAPGGHETILMAEDDEEVRRLIKKILENFGYKVILTENGEEAVAAFIADRGAIDLLLMDVIMPKKNGKAAFEEIRAIRPDIRALFMSGHTTEHLQSGDKLEPGADFISKPVSMNDLLLKVRQVLDKRP